VRLPRFVQPEIDRETPEVRPPVSPTSIVLVEDAEDIRVTLGELLIMAGHDVTTAVDGPNGVATILARRPTVAFVDIGLPVFDGYEVARRVRSAGVPVRLIAVTGYGQPDDVRRAREAGFDRHLKKPVGLLELEDAMRT
jgi:CheY-like chemotaxis protein